MFAGLRSEFHDEMSELRSELSDEIHNTSSNLVSRHVFVMIPVNEKALIVKQQFIIRFIFINYNSEWANVSSGTGSPG